MYQETALTLPSRTPFIPPAALIVGATQETVDYAVRYIQNHRCSYGGCKTCSTCSQIAEQNHYQLLWITPEQRYTLEAIAPISDIIQLSLEDDDHFFFVLSHADTLSAACAHSLLKIVEEPPAGYHFIFLAQRLDEVLPTIQSRCIITHVGNDNKSLESHPLYQFFTIMHHENLLLFLKTVEQSKITEQECMRLCDALFVYWNNVCIKSTDLHKQQLAYTILLMLKKHMLIPPMTGSTKLFLKNLYLNMYHILQKKMAP